MVPVQVQDLHAVSPRTFLEVAGGIVHGLSYQQARNNTSRVGQVSRLSAKQAVTPDKHSLLSACMAFPCLTAWHLQLLRMIFRRLCSSC